MARRVSRLLTSAFAFALLTPLAAQSPAPSPSGLLNHVSAERMRADVSYLASDALAGRFTPSPELDQAADYIAEQFRSAGLAPVDGSYFQVAPWNESDREGRTVRNVVGLLRGSGGELRETYIIVSAHYDHVGVEGKKDEKDAKKDRIYNGANDNASGVATMIELARAFASRSQHPQRSILFIAYFGEEVGMLGSYYYAEHPLVPLEATVAQVNLEQIGRPSKQNRLVTTGYRFSNLSETMKGAAAAEGIDVRRTGESDAYFALSDNLALALLGIPAHTLSTAFEYKDHHKVTDSAEKLDYENMARVTRGIAAGLWRLAETEEPPKWNEKYRPAARYLEAARESHVTSLK